ncbi:LacI family DNA-binding transcriptional regulator [Tropicimonas sp. IMCC6043]|uniref:LacI family DNA-binding transcriptional regulator n=1 Tax=Tropicimonas sp. IMCC6043 TaxID=2510645 RepID=UPI00101CE668|nr:LacI family DNA-binding transcriptional regulator [Tropicimonas sp. IMCC6043]RYH06069.1 LacI family DNA-binding transcriptional regulator [Tropicimonas sp. IMCC6043]
MKPKQRLPDRKSKVTIREVALNAKVSETTVSRIMRNEGPISEETREKVMKSVRELGYVPNRIAGALASLNTHLVGVIVPSLKNIVFPEVLRGIQSGLKGNHMQAVISVTEYDLATEEEMVRGLLAWNPVAVLVTGLTHNEATSRMLRQSLGRVVEMMEIDAEPIDAAVGMSHRSAGYETIRHLLTKGYRRFGYVAHDIGPDRRARLRHEGMVQALSEAGLGFIAESRAETPSSVGIGKAMTARLLERAPDISVAIYSNDDMAVGGVFHCMETGRSIPSDLAIFGFNGLEIGQQLPQPLSTVRSNRFLIGRTAIEQILNDKERPGSPVRVDTGFEIVDGATA